MSVANPVSVVLGAGASRAVSYADRCFPSPLDRDFFDLLQRFRPRYRNKAFQRKVEEAGNFIVEKALMFDDGRLVDSMERIFYTLHQNAVLHHKLFPQEFTSNPDDDLQTKFTIATQALLRSAHGTRACRHHVKLFRPLRGADAILTFNYDLVAERALRSLYERKAEFGVWLYGVGPRQDDMPTLHKLHGSVNWEVGENKEIQPRQKSWSDF
jgi:hypothetical protein